MKMLTQRQKSCLSLSGGHIVVDQLMVPSYSPNAQSFPWEEDVNEINTPDIDPSFFDSDPFKIKMKSHTGIDPFPMASDDHYLMTAPHEICYVTCDESSQQSHQQSYEDMNLSQILSQTNVDINALIKESESVVISTDEVLIGDQYIPVTTAPVLHYMQPKSNDSIALSVITSNTSFIDSNTSQSIPESVTQFSSPSHSSSHSYSPALSANHTYLSPNPSPALSYTSTLTGSPSTMVSMDAITSDSSTIIEDLVDTKPDMEFLQPTVINDHLYTLPSASGLKRRKSSTDKTVRSKNSTTSKKPRVTKRDKQKIMDEQIENYIKDNERCRKSIEQMEREIEWCKNFLFQKVVAAAKK